MKNHKSSAVVFVLSLIFAGLLGSSILAQDKESGKSIELPAKDDGLPGAGPIRRYDWFRSLWNQKRAEWAKRVAQDQKSLVFLGDSITQGWGDNFDNSFPGVKTANRGISGDTTRGMLIRLQDDVLALNRFNDK